MQQLKITKNEPRLERVFRGYKPKTWSIIKIFPDIVAENTNNATRQYNYANYPYIFVKCNGIISTLYCTKCKSRFQCLTGREHIIVDENLFNSMYDSYRKRGYPLLILKEYLFSKIILPFKRDKNGRFN